MSDRFSTGATYMIQQNISGTGVFDGTHVGYAFYTYSAGGASFIVRYTQMGAADGNGMKLAMLDPGTTHTAKTTVMFDPTSNVLTVVLRRTLAGIQATAKEVVDAINQYQPTNPNFSKYAKLFKAGLVTDALIPAGLAPAAFTGGLDPVWSQGASRLYPPANAKGGLFFFSQEGPWMIRAIGGKLAASVAMKVRIANVTPDLRIISGEIYTIYSATCDEFSVSDVQLPLFPDQAIIVEAATTGMVQVSARAESGLPQL